MTNGPSVIDMRTELDDAERAILIEDRKRWAKLGTGAQLDEWLAFGPGLMIRRKIAMRIAQTNEPIGRRYTDAFIAQMAMDGLYDPSTTTNVMKTTFTAVLFFHEEPVQRRLDVLAEIRCDMTAGECARLNSPITARQKVEKALRERGIMDAAKPPAKAAPKPASDLKCELEQVKARNSELVEELHIARGEDGPVFDLRNGAEFDLRKDALKDIAKKIVMLVSPNRAEKIAHAILKALREQSEAPTPTKPRTIKIKVTHETKSLLVPYTTLPPKPGRGAKKIKVIEGKVEPNPFTVPAKVAAEIAAKETIKPLVSPKVKHAKMTRGRIRRREFAKLAEKHGLPADAFDPVDDEKVEVPPGDEETVH
jgi:hypothetical protein